MGTNKTSQNNHEKTLYLNGIKGMACIIVFIMHFIITFYPAVFNGPVFSAHLPGSIDAIITQTPLMSLINGRIMVGVFMVISGMILTLQVMKCTDRKRLAQIVTKRYFRFTLVLFFFCLFVFILRSCDLFLAEELVEITDARGTKGVYSKELSFLDVFTHAFYFVPFKKDTTFSIAFWCIRDMIIGSFISILCGMAAHNSRKRIIFIFFLLYGLLAYMNEWSSAYVLGSILAYVFFHKDEFPKFKNRLVYDIAGVVLFLIGMTIGTYPWRIEPTNFYAALGAWLPQGMNKATFFEILGGFLIVSGISMSNVRRIFDTRLMQFLGKISFSVYLLHVPIIYSVGAGAMIFLQGVKPTYIRNTILVFVVVTAITIVLSWLFNKYVERFCTFLLNKIISFNYKPDNQNNTADNSGIHN